MGVQCIDLPNSRKSAWPSTASPVYCGPSYSCSSFVPRPHPTGPLHGPAIETLPHMRSLYLALSGRWGQHASFRACVSAGVTGLPMQWINDHEAGGPKPGPAFETSSTWGSCSHLLCAATAPHTLSCNIRHSFCCFGPPGFLIPNTPPSFPLRPLDTRFVFGLITSTSFQRSALALQHSFGLGENRCHEFHLPHRQVASQSQYRTIHRPAIPSNGSGKRTSRNASNLEGSVVRAHRLGTCGVILQDTTCRICLSFSRRPLADRLPRLSWSPR